MKKISSSWLRENNIRTDKLEGGFLAMMAVSCILNNVTLQGVHNKYVGKLIDVYIRTGDTLALEESDKFLDNFIVQLHTPANTL